MMGLKYLLSGSLQKKLANPCTRLFPSSFSALMFSGSISLGKEMERRKTNNGNNDYSAISGCAIGDGLSKSGAASLTKPMEG